MLNRALRLMEVDLIIKMGFFVQDLHNHIVELHAEQYGGHHHSNPFTVYRGQGLSSTDFEQLMKTQGGLMSFNNFLSTSENLDVSLNFAQQTIHSSNLVGVLFVIKIDPSITGTPFANIENVHYYQVEKKILFSMHSIFRIENIKQIDENDRLWQVDLILTGENDPQLCALTERIREETFSGCEGWERLGMLLIQLGQFNKAEELYDILLNQTTNDGEKAHLYHMLGMVKRNQGKYEEAVGFYEKSIKIKQKILPPTHSDLATSYNCLGVVYDNMGEYSMALSCYEKGLEIRQKTLPANHPDLATSYNNIGWAYNKMNEYSKAISYYEKVLEIRQKTLPVDYSDLANSYNNIGGVYYYMRDYSNALSYYERTLNIQQRSLPPNHPDLEDVKKTIEIVKKDIANDNLCCLS
jgi:tetratricopeptide (TPR) repeat protein